MLWALCGCVLVTASHFSCLMPFMSQCTAQASSCLAGSVAGLQSGVLTEFPDTASAQMVLTADLSGAKSPTSQQYVTNHRVLGHG